MDDSWEHEKNMLFPDLTYKMADDLPEKFTSCYLTDSSQSETVIKEIAGKKTILHYVQDLSRGVTKDSDSEVAYFDKIHQLFMCGCQPKEINGFYFKVRYKYVGNGSPERGFCKDMMSAAKVYRKEDIEKLSLISPNKGFGEGGADTYAIWLYKGGARCHHKWERRTYVSASKTASIGSAKTNQISTNKARKFGYRVAQEKQVAMMPNDMPLKGFSPNNPNLPSDVQ